LTWRSYSITFAPCDFAAFSIAIEEPASSETRMTTFAPALRHWSAWERCRWASPLALLITYETPAFLNAATRAGRSCVSQRTDVFGSGSSTQMSAFPPVTLVGFAPAPPTATLTVKAATTRATMTLFTVVPSISSRTETRSTSRDRQRRTHH
jgi:hypothetical protein